MILFFEGLMTGSRLVAAKVYLTSNEEVAGEHFICKKGDVLSGGTRGFVIEGGMVPYILFV
ncbi:hypothetical protein [Flavobacterium sp. 7A]|uniref:hypothetical protein n=1 Tax=Flavobacterium sp. 7A TaxID=2940571 RepID=UPI0022260B07|nr:hypothetical protein [Flavobacterium sp. 7A]